VVGFVVLYCLVEFVLVGFVLACGRDGCHVVGWPGCRTCGLLAEKEKVAKKKKVVSDPALSASLLCCILVATELARAVASGIHAVRLASCPLEQQTGFCSPHASTLF